MMSASEGGSRKSDKCRQGGGGGQKTGKICRHHLSMAPNNVFPMPTVVTREIISIQQNDTWEIRWMEHV